MEEMQYLDELPVIQGEQTPLSDLIRRLCVRLYQSLRELVETLPGLESDDAKKQAIVDFVLFYRRQVIKLLVITRWSAAAEDVARCVNTIAFLQRQNYAFASAIEQLTQIKNVLGGARARNYDLPTALDVLTRGTYTQLPSSIRDTFDRNEKLGRAEIESVLTELDEHLRWQLACLEDVPPEMTDYVIDSGRATFTLPRWTATVTHDPAADAPRWYMLDLTLLGSETSGPLRDRIIEVANHVLSSEKPLQALYNFLQPLVLNYELEQLYAQSHSIAGVTYHPGKKLVVEYWRKPDVPVYARGGVIIISVGEGSDDVDGFSDATGGGVSAVSAASAGSAATAASIANTSVSSVPRASTRGDRRKAILADALAETTQGPLSNTPQSLTVRWMTAEGAQTVPDETELGPLRLAELVERITHAHAERVAASLLTTLRTVFTTDELTPHDCAIRLQLFRHNCIDLIVDARSGRLQIKALGEVSMARENRLSNATERINKDASLLVETLLRVRASTILDELETRTIALGWATSRRLPVRGTDLARVTHEGHVPRALLFVQLTPALPSYFLVLVVSDVGLRLALLSTYEHEDSAVNVMLAIEELGWVDTDLSIYATPPPGWLPWDADTAFLQRVHAACLRRIAYFAVEGQLAQRHIPYRFDDNLLVLKARDLAVGGSAPPVGTFAHSNAAIQCYLRDAAIKTTLWIRLLPDDIGALDTSLLPKHISLDVSSCTLVMAVDDVHSAVELFIQAYATIARTVLVSRKVAPSASRESRAKRGE